MEKEIKKYFDEFEVPYEPDHWVLMQQRIEIEELSDFAIHQDQSFDSFIRKEFTNHTVPYNDAHWQILESKINRISVFQNFKNLMRNAAAVLLLILAGTTLFMNRGTLENKSYIAENPLTSGQKHGSIVENNSNQFSLIHSGKLDPAISAYKAPDNNVKSLPVLVNGIKTGKENIKIRHLSTTFVQHKEERENLGKIYNNMSVSFDRNISSAQVALQSVKYPATGSNFRLGIFGVTAIDQYSTDIEGQPKEPSTYGLAVGGGLSLSWQLNQFEIETGAAYNSIKSIHSQNELAENLALNKFNNLGEENSEKYLRLPIALKYLLPTNSSWKFYALGGGNVHINLGGQNDVLSTASATFPGFGAKISNQPITETDPSKIQDSFFNRLYYTANIGLGIEKQLGKRVSVFAQPEYYHQLFKPAIANDKGQINTFAISVGVKTKL